MSLIARLIAIGAPADIIEDVAMLVAEAKTATATIEARKKKDRERKALKNFPRNSTESMEKESTPPKEYIQTPHAKKITPLTPQFDFVGVWNEMAVSAGLPTCQAMSRQRKASLRQRLADYGEPAMRQAIAAVGQSAFCRGENDRGWKANPDFVLQEKSLIKILEGQYGSLRSSPVDERQAYLSRKYGT